MVEIVATPIPPQVKTEAPTPYAQLLTKAELITSETFQSERNELTEIANNTALPEHTRQAATAILKREYDVIDGSHPHA
jgi:hypothetical protein